MTAPIAAPTAERFDYDPIDLLTVAADAGEDIMEAAIALGSEYREGDDQARYRLGDLACIVQKRYGHNAIARFSIGVRKKVASIQEYRTVCGRFDKICRADIFEQYPSVTYSDLRTVGRLLKKYPAEYGMKHAYRFFDMIDRYGWSVERAEVRINRLIGKPVKAEPVLISEATLLTLLAEGTQIVFEVPRGLTKDLKQGVVYQLKVSEVQP